MCYRIVISTTSELDLCELNTPLVQFSRNVTDVCEASLLHFPNKWYLASGGCSCGFRHLSHGNEKLGFAEPVDWWPEEPQSVEATLQVVGFFKVILHQGQKLDCIDAWAPDGTRKPAIIGDLNVSFAIVPDSCFRFFEGHRFEFRNKL